MSVQTPVHRPDERSDESDQLDHPRQTLASNGVPHPGRRKYVASYRYGVLALLIAAGGLTAVMVLQSGPSTEAPATPVTSPVEAPRSVALPAAPPLRDQWYLDKAHSSGSGVTALPVPPVRDDWYLDDLRFPSLRVSAPAVPPVRDQWYLDDAPSTSARVSAPAEPPVRDQWYLDNAQVTSPRVTAPAVLPVRDQWYLDNAQLTSQGVTAPAVPPVRDQWYLDNAQVTSPRVTALPVRDQWYVDDKPDSVPAVVAATPGEIVNAYLAAQSRGDAQGALDLLTDDAILEAAQPDACAAPNPCAGKSSIETNLISRILGGHPQLTPIDQFSAGNTVTTHVEVRNDGVRSAGFERYIATTTAQISGDKIQSFKIVRDLTDPETAAFNRAQTGP